MEKNRNLYGSSRGYIGTVESLNIAIGYSTVKRAKIYFKVSKDDKNRNQEFKTEQSTVSTDVKQSLIATGDDKAGHYASAGCLI